MTQVNDQITDSVTQTNVKVVGESPAIAVANHLLSISHSLALAAYNAVSHQEHSQVVALSSAVEAIAGLSVKDTAMITDMSVKMSKNQESVLEKLMELEAILAAFKPRNPYT